MMGERAVEGVGGLTVDDGQLAFVGRRGDGGHAVQGRCEASSDGKMIERDIGRHALVGGEGLAVTK